MTPVLMLAAVAAAQVPPAAGVQVGVTAAAPTTVSADPATYDLAGFRLGMSEADVEAVIRTRGLTVVNRTRAPDFEDRVRTGLRMHHRAAVRDTGRTVLDTARLDDVSGGRIHLRMLGWPDGARVDRITYIVPTGTPMDRWRSMLEGKYGDGRPRDGLGDEVLRLDWCGPGDCRGAFRFAADVGPGGGTIELRQPDGTSRRLARLLDAEVTRRGRSGTPAL